MKNRIVHPATRDLDTLLNEGAVGMLSDGQLLDRFVEWRRAAAFEAIVGRYGPLVWGVCRRVLRDHHDAEDAFQATFLVLARKAASVMPREKLGNWLYGVAFQTAMKARATMAKRRARERPGCEMTEPEAVPEDRPDELLARLDREVNRLPEKYRTPIILCELEGKTHRQAAEQLGWPVGTVSGRLSRARALLASRLSRPDTPVTVGALGVLLAHDVAWAGVPPELVRSTARAAGKATTTGLVSAEIAALTEEVLKTMLLSKLKLATAMLLMVFALGAGATTLTYRAHATEPLKLGEAVSEEAPPRDDRPKPADAPNLAVVREGQDVSSLATKDLQGRIRSSIEKALPTIVFLGWEGGTGTGVIISPEGLILTQGHVIGSPMKAGLKFRLSFQDGTAAEAEVVGADTLYDLALLRLVKPGAYPFATLAEQNPAAGTGVIKLGYPVEAQQGIDVRTGRRASARFGAVLATKAERATEPDTFVTDCAINGGDSGGPFVDLDGRIVGIVRVGTAIRDEPLQSKYHHNLQTTRGRLWYAGTPSPLIRKRLARMAKGEFIEPTDAERARLDVWDMTGKDPILYRDLIAEPRWTQGKETLGRFRHAVADARRSVVEVLDGDKPTARGTVVNAAGLVLTKASEVPENARCRLPDGRVTPAQVVGVDPAYDLALLRVPAEALVPVAWAKAADPPAGTLVAAVGTGELPVAVGIVSLPRRDTPGPHPTASHRYARPDLIAGPPELTGFIAPDGGFVVETSEGNAAGAGIRRGDVVLTMAGKPVPDNSWLKKSPKQGAGLYIPISGMNRYDQSWYTFQSMLPLATSVSDTEFRGEKIRRAGERLPVRILRGGEQIEVSLELPAPKEGELGFSDQMVSSRHAIAAPTVITADIPVYPSECGAPAVGADGTVLGLVISRFGPTGSYMIPADRVAARLADLNAGKPLPGFTTPAPAARPGAAAPNPR